jgi:hypothetical protein
MKVAATESLNRSCDFQPGRGIELADGQAWIFPCPSEGTSISVGSARDEYYGLIRAIAEAEDKGERQMADLAMAIFLLRLNYRLTSEDLQYLFTFPSDSERLRNSQVAFRALATDHLRHECESAPATTSDAEQEGRIRPGALPLFHRLRALWRLRRWPVASRQGEVLS